MQENRGVVKGCFGAGPGSGLAFLAIERDDGSILTVAGDWRAIFTIAEDCEGQEVEVVDGDEGDIIRPVVESDVVLTDSQT